MADFGIGWAEEKSLRLEQEPKINSILLERNKSKNDVLMAIISFIRCHK